MTTVLDVSTQDPVHVVLGAREPPLISLILAADGTTLNTSLATALTFFMRPLLSRNPVVTAAAAALWPVDDKGNNVQYQWGTTDTVVEGEYMGWFGYSLSGFSTPAYTPEFRIVISDAGPGYGVQTGVIVDGIAQWMPITLDRLRQEPTFGDRFLQKHADYVKQIVMGTVVAPDAEASYNPFLVEYLSKRTAARLIAPARDYWSRQYRQVLTQGPSESATYPDMLASLDLLDKRLCHELPADWRQLQMIVPGLPQLRIEPMPMSSLGDAGDPRNGPVTGDPQASRPARTGGPHWSPWFQF